MLVPEYFLTQSFEYTSPCHNHCIDLVNQTKDPGTNIKRHLVLKEVEEFHDNQRDLRTDDKMQWVESDLIDNVIHHTGDFDGPSPLLD